MPIVNCEVCGTPKHYKPSRIAAGYGRFCGGVCYGLQRQDRVEITCARDGCGVTKIVKPSANRKFCSDECARLDKLPTAESTHDRVWSKIEIGEPSWIWTGAENGQGQAHFMLSKTPHVDKHVTHYLWWEKTGHWPQEGEAILHTCDIPLCMRVDDEGVYPVGDRILPRWGHLALGTQADNDLDKIIKGRQARGERAGGASITDAIALDIRDSFARGESRISIAKRLKTTRGVVDAVVGGKTWKHVGGPPLPPTWRTDRQAKRAQFKQQIRAEYATGGITQYQLAEKHGISQSRVSKIINEPPGVSHEGA